MLRICVKIVLFLDLICPKNISSITDVGPPTWTQRFCPGRFQPEKMWIVEGADVELECTCGHQVPNHNGILWMANFSTSQSSLNKDWKSKTIHSGSRLNSGGDGRPEFLIGHAAPHVGHLRIHPVTTKRNLTCKFPFFNLGKEFGECIPTGPNQENCWCATHEGIDISDTDDDRITRGKVDPLSMTPKEIEDHTKWDFCRCPQPIRDHPIYTAEDYPSVSMPCHFPFIFKDSVYHGCTDIPPPPPDMEIDMLSVKSQRANGCLAPCSSETSYQDNGRCDFCGGFCCGLALNKDNKCSTMLTDYLSTQKNILLTKLYCIHVSDIRPANSGCWCGLTENVNDNPKSWGFCPCAISVEKGDWSPWSSWTPCMDCGQSSIRSRACVTKTSPKAKFGPKLISLCDGNEFDRRSCTCSHHQTIRNRSTINPLTRNLEIKSIQSHESGKYFCVHDRNQIQTVKNSEIVSRIELFVVAKDTAKYVEDFDLPKEDGLIFKTQIHWELLDTISCSDCGPFSGEKRQMALCSKIDKHGKMRPCEKSSRLFHQIRLEPCHIPCRKKLNQVGTTMVLSALNGIPALPTIYDIYWTTMVGTAGEPLRFDCKGRKKLTTISKPVAWRFTATSGSETIPILRWNTLIRENETLPLFQPDDSLHFERLHHENSGIYKCYVNYELVTIIKVEVIGWYIHLIKSFLSSLTLIVVSIMFLILLSALCLPAFKKMKEIKQQISTKPIATEVEYSLLAKADSEEMNSAEYDIVSPH